MLPINAFSVENFKSFGPKQRLPLSRINFLFGPNSHGKSSSLLALGILTKGFFFKKFNLDRIVHADNSPDLMLGDNLLNTTTNTGSFCIGCEIKLGEKTEIEVKYHALDLIKYGLSKVEIHEIVKGEKSLVLSMDKFVVKINTDTNLVRHLIKDQNLNELANEFNSIYEINNFKIYLNNLEVEAFSSFSIEDDPEGVVFIEPTKTEMVLMNIINEVLNIINTKVKEHYHDLKSTMDRRMDEGKSFDSVYYNPFIWIGPNRYVPEKNIFIEGEDPFLKNNLMNVEAINRLNKWIDDSQLLSIDYHFVLNKFDSKNYHQLSNFSLKEFGVSEKKGEPFQKLTEVGSGLGHIFQIIIPFFNNPKLIILQQPEIHLHPSLQTQLARSLFTLAEEYDIQLIIETHSEHFIKAAQLEIAKGLSMKSPTMCKDDVSVLYVSKDENGFSKVKQIQLDETGAFTEPWPDDFFELSADLSLERLRQSYKSKN